jgi:hypothetical protein
MAAQDAEWEYRAHTERDARVAQWLEDQGMTPLVPAYLSLQNRSPRVLAGLDDTELQEIFLSMQSKDPHALARLFGSMCL